MALLKLSPVNKTLKGHKLLLIPKEVPQDAIERIESLFPDLEVAFGSDSPDLFKDVTIVLTLFKFPSIEEAPKLQLGQLVSAGANAILDQPIFTDTETPWCTSSGVHGPQISEWVIGTYLAAQNSIPQYLKFQEEETWKPDRTNKDDSLGKRVGILGYGSIGRQVARVCKAMGMDIHAYTLHAKPTPESRRDNGYIPKGLGDPDGEFPSKWFSGGSKSDLHEFLGSGLDLLVISLPLTDQTRHLISKSELGILGKTATFVSNISRGPIIKTDDLIDALNDHVIRGAAVDVTDPEPLPQGHPLWKAKNIIITPHVSGGTKNYFNRCLEIFTENLVRFSEGKRLMNQISRKEGY